MLGKWVLEEKNGVKYFTLEFHQTKFKKFLCIFITKIGGLKFNINDKEDFISDIDWVRKNFKLSNIHYLNQIHSDEIFYISDNKTQMINSGDGLYTDQQNIFLSIRVADCLPIYFIVPDRSIIGLAHCGWQGTLKRIGLKLVAGIQERYDIKKDQIYYFIGPSIDKCCYEIKQDVAEKFKLLIKDNIISNALIVKRHRIFLDLRLINDRLFENIGIRKIANIDTCSFCNKEILYSARRGDKLYRNLALIGITKA